MEEQSPTIKVIIQGQEVLGSIVDGGSRVNVLLKPPVIDWASQNGRHVHSGYEWLIPVRCDQSD